jgi:NADPH-dependent 2,4-dienoyl-CoA reductase/sulfur reductase-like enzyme
VGDVIKGEKDLLVATPELFKNQFNVEVKLGHEVLSIDRKKKEIEVKDVDTGELTRERYDALVLSPGSVPIRPPLPGIDLPGISFLRNLRDGQQIREAIEEKKPVKQCW